MRRPVTVLSVAALGILVGTLLAAAPAAASALPSAGSSGAGEAAVVKAPPPAVSVHADELRAHAGEAPAMAAGDLASVGFRPSPDDSWPVGGVAPRPLPAGRASGAEMAAEAQGDGEASTGEAFGPVAPVTGGGEAADGAFVGSRKQVLGFLPYWELGATLNYKVLTTVAYFAVNADRNGNLLKKNADGSLSAGWAGWTSAKMTSVINNAHANGVRVVLTVAMFAWDTDDAAVQSAFLGSSAAQANLAAQIAAAVRDRGADGVNLDFEPIATGGGPGLAAFVRTLRAQLNAISPGYQLTLDATGYVGNYPLAQLNTDGALDAVLLMGYDFRGPTDAVAGSIDPLAASGIYDLSDAVAAFTAKMPASKIILGLPWYGRAWSTTSNALHATTQAGVYGQSVAAEYSLAASLGAQYGTKYDTDDQTAWTAYYGTWGTSPTWRELYWDNPQAHAAKADFINAKGLRGAGIWALGYDGGRTELYNVLASKFPAATAASSAPSVTFTGPAAGTTKIVTSTANTVTWSISAPAGLRSATVTELYGRRTTAASCAGVTWATAWTTTSRTSPMALAGFMRNYCYRWTIKVTDGAGRTASASSGSLLIATIPTIAWTFPPPGKTTIGYRSNTIRWSATDPSGIVSIRVQEWFGRPVNGACTSVAWTSNWIGNYRSPLTLYGFTPGCYRYSLTVRSGNGISASANSGNLLVR